ncbi:hypothetical protein BDV93DRAFT_547578 [Ceratobasidium sp. AG-I]|nr:hypothetical protein BDV93DRAFT_547578 [Ceratobasidium sp. AG-I]
MTPTSTPDWFPPISNDLLIEFVGQDVMLDLVDLMPQLLSVSFSWIWGQLEGGTPAARDLSHDNDLIRHATFTFDIARRLYANAGANGMSTKTISSFTKAVLESDVVNLVGRLILIPTVNGSKASKLEEDVNPEDPDDPNKIAKNWNRLTEKIISFSEAYAQTTRGTNGLLMKSYPDWLKTWNSFTLEFPHHPIPSWWFKKHIQSCKTTWMVLGLAFDYTAQERRDHRLCDNDRCFGPVRTGYADRTCRRCLHASYCSALCQNAHWQSSTVGSHKQHCSEQKAHFSARS